MSKASHPAPNKLLTELLAKNATATNAVMGYVNTSENADYITLYKSIFRLSKSFEIKKSDIIHWEDAPETLLPLGAVILWLKKDSEIFSRRLVVKSQQRENFVERRSGRLQMKFGINSFTGKCTGCSDGDTGKCTGCSDGSTGKCTGCSDGSTGKCTNCSDSTRP